MDQAGRDALRQRLYTAGELLRLNQLAPDTKAVQESEHSSYSKRMALKLALTAVVEGAR
jgi:hypothetical protein